MSYPRLLVNRFAEWMEDGLDGDAFSILGRFLIFVGLTVAAVVVFLVIIASIVVLLGGGEPACDPGSHRWTTHQGKTTISKCIPDSVGGN